MGTFASSNSQVIVRSCSSPSYIPLVIEQANKVNVTETNAVELSRANTAAESVWCASAWSAIEASDTRASAFSVQCSKRCDWCGHRRQDAGDGIRLEIDAPGGRQPSRGRPTRAAAISLSAGGAACYIEAKDLPLNEPHPGKDS
jgi:hypothetical protein